MVTFWGLIDLQHVPLGVELVQRLSNAQWLIRPLRYRISGLGVHIFVLVVLYADKLSVSFIGRLPLVVCNVELLVVFDVYELRQ